MRGFWAAGAHRHCGNCGGCIRVCLEETSKTQVSFEAATDEGQSGYQSGGLAIGLDAEIRREGSRAGGAPAVTDLTPVTVWRGRPPPGQVVVPPRNTPREGPLLFVTTSPCGHAVQTDLSSAFSNLEGRSLPKTFPETTQTRKPGNPSAQVVKQTPQGMSCTPDTASPLLRLSPSPPLPSSCYWI